MFCDITKH